MKNKYGNLIEYDWSFKGEKSNYLTHDLHPYTAKFVPKLANVLIDFFTSEGDKIFDPFCGSGTALVEAFALNRDFIGSDISPLASLISRTKTTKLTTKQIKEIKKIEEECRKEIDFLYRRGFQSRFNDNVYPNIPHIEKWFNKIALAELSIIRDKIMRVKDENTRNVLLTVFSSIITVVSNQDSETRYTANPNKKIQKFSVINRFSEKLSRTIEKMVLLNELETGSKGEVIVDDARELSDVDSLSIDFIVTSPPYLNAWDYNLYHRFRFYWLNFDVNKYRKNEIGAHLSHSYSDSSPDRFFEDMRKALMQMHRVLRDGKFCCIVIGNSTVRGKKVNSVEKLIEIAETVGFSHVNTIERHIPQTRKTMNSKIGRITKESLIILQKDKNIPKGDSLFAFTFQDYVKHGLERDLAIIEVKRFFDCSPIYESEKKIIFKADLSGDYISNLRKIALFKRVQVMNSQGYLTLIPDEVFFEYSDFLSKFVDDKKKIKYYLGRIAKNHFGHKVSKYLSHSFHDYIGRFYPQIVRSLIFSYNTTTGQVLDPFSGSGTTQIESSLMSISSIGIENNPLQAFLTNTKIKSLIIPANKIDKSLEKLNERMHSPLPLDQSNTETIRGWFSEGNLLQLLRIKAAIDEEQDTDIRNFFLLSLSSITKEVSKWAIGQARVRKSLSPVSDVDVYAKFLRRAREYTDIIKIFQIIKHKVGLDYEYSKVLNGDSKEMSSLVSNQFSLVLTSPPYANALPYIETDILPAMLLSFYDKTSYKKYLTTEIGNREIDPAERDLIERNFLSKMEELIPSSDCRELIQEFIRENSLLPRTNFRRKDHAAVLIKYYSDMNKIINEVYRVLLPDGVFIIVIGNNRLRAGERWLEVKSDKYISDMAENRGFILEQTFQKNIEGTTNFFSKIKHESILIFRKPK